jgi:hypothetical protein
VSFFNQARTFRGFFVLQPIKLASHEINLKGKGLA